MSIDNACMRNAADIAELLVSNGTTLTAVPGTILSRLNTTLVGAGLGNLTGVTSDDPADKLKLDSSFIQMLVECSTNGEPGRDINVEHGILLDTIAKEIAGYVAGTMSFARNTVNPIVKQITDDICAALDEASKGGTLSRWDGGSIFKSMSGALTINLNNQGPDPIWSDGTLENYCSSHATYQYKKLGSPRIYPRLDGVAVADLIRNNVKGDLAKDALACVENREGGYDFLSSIYNDVYSNNGEINTGIFTDDIRNMRDESSALVILIGEALLEDVPEGTYGNLSEIGIRTAEWVGQCKAATYHEIQAYKKSLEQKQVVLDVYSDGLTVNVNINRDVYDEYLEDGGTTEAVIGAYLSNAGYNYSELLENRVKLETVYDNKCAQAAQIAISNRLTIFRDVLHTKVYEAIFECEEGAIRPVQKAKARELLDEEIKHVYAESLECPFETVRRVVCRSVFHGTDAEKILTNLDALCKARPESDIRENAAVAMINYISEYVGSQIKVNKPF